MSMPFLNWFWGGVQGILHLGHCKDFFPILDQAVEELHKSGFHAEAIELHEAFYGVAWTTSSEMCGEIGQQIRAVQRHLGNQLPAQAGVFLDQAILEIKKVWPRI